MIAPNRGLGKPLGLVAHGGGDAIATALIDRRRPHLTRLQDPR
jgi:hypothetical protein